MKQQLDTLRTHELFGALWSLEVEERAVALRKVAEEPTGDARIVAALVTQMGDSHICEHSPGRVWGELRELAARALAGERRLRAQETGADRAGKVRIVSVPVPRTATQIDRLERAHQLDPLVVDEEGTLADFGQRYARLRRLDLLPLRTVEL